MPLRERLKNFKGRLKQRFQEGSPAQSTQSLPIDPQATSPEPRSTDISESVAPASSASLTVVATTLPVAATPALPIAAASPAAVSPAPTSVVPAVPESTSEATPVAPGAEPTCVNHTWTSLGHFQQVVTTASTIFGPLKPAIDDLAGCISMYEDAAAARRDYGELKVELERLFNTLGSQFAGDVPPIMIESMQVLRSAIEKELDGISSRRGRGTGRRLWEANKDLDEVMACYRRIRGYLDNFMIETGVTTVKIADEQATDNRLKTLTPSLSACYDSAAAATVRRRDCTPGTRQQVLEDLNTWRQDKNKGNIYWMNGMAGTGKTTIATTFCAMLKQAQKLGASFFCTRQLPECRNVNLILPTIAYQLACFSRPFRAALSRALERDPNLHTKALPIQLEGLVTSPLREVGQTLPTDVVVVIDALDECDDRNGVGNILELLVKHASELPIKVFVSSRPEEQVRRNVGSMKSQLALHELDDKIVKGDIEMYLKAELEDVSISEPQMSQLVERAGVLFIYAATVVRYIKTKNSDEGRQGQLNKVLNASSSASSNKNKDIDALYSVVLASAFSNPDLEEDDIAAMRLILHTVICAQEPLTVMALTGLLQLGNGGTVRDALEPLWSVLHVFKPGEDSLVTTLHASFPDYMLDPKRSGEHSCIAKSHHGRLAELCLARIQNNERQFNICHLESSYVLDDEISGLDDRVKQAIPSDLAYACHYWAVHLELGGPSIDRLKLMDEFLSKRLLLWMEVLNLEKRMNLGPMLLDKARQWCTSLDCESDEKDLVNDAWRFATTFAANPVSRSTSHLYVSMLACWPNSRPISKHYTPRTKHLVKVAGGAMERRELALLGIIHTNSPVRSVAFSPNGTHIGSGSLNKIGVWDAQTGQIVFGPVEGHTDSVLSVAFSPDGKRIVSGSDDKTIRVWDAQAGQMVLGPLEGHTGSVNSVVFSPDGVRIVSGSSDTTIRVWDAQTGQMMLEPLEGHTCSVWSVAFSPDGQRIVSGSSDKTIRVWDAQTGQMVLRPLEEHTYSVFFVAFSPDGMRIVSGSVDGRVRVWDIQTGQMILKPLERFHPAYSIAFSPDGMRIVSSSFDTIQVRDAQTGQMVLGPLEGHTSAISSLTFSADSMRIASGSHDETIRVWDAQTGQTLGPLEGHSHSVNSVAFSPDGVRIVSGSLDNTIWVWDAQTGRRVLGPLQGHTESVYAVAFSPDGLYIVSGSSDKTIRVWDAQSGQIALEPLEGHTEPVISVAFSHDGIHVVSGSSDTTIRVWDAHTGQMVLGPLTGHIGAVLSVTFSPDGKIVSGSSDATIRVWDSQTGRMMLEPLERRHTSSVGSVVFSPDGVRVVSGSSDKTIRVWDAQTGQMMLEPLEGHTASVKSVAFSPDSMYVVSGSSDRTIRVWDVQTGQMVLGPLQGHTGDVTSVAFSPDGRHLISGSWDKTIRAWRMPHFSIPVSPTTPIPPLPQTQIVVPFFPTPLSWQLQSDGWVVDKHMHLLWIPHDLRNFLLHPLNTFLISARGSVKLNFEGAAIGESWAECYQPALV